MEVEKTVWVDVKNKIVSFHAIDSSIMITKEEALFWDFLLRLMKTNYRVM